MKRPWAIRLLLFSAAALRDRIDARSGPTQAGIRHPDGDGQPMSMPDLFLTPPAVLARLKAVVEPS